MRVVSMLELRRRAEEIIGRVRKGERMILTYRGKPVARLAPLPAEGGNEDDPFYALDRLAETRGRSLSNEEIDRIVYGL